VVATTRVLTSQAAPVLGQASPKCRLRCRFQCMGADPYGTVAPDRVTIPILLLWLALYTVILLFGAVLFA
jgi:hypothetical protein